MKFWPILVLSAFISSLAWALPQEIVEENYYNEFRQLIKNKNQIDQTGLIGFTAYEQSLFVDALWDLLDEENSQALEILNQVDPLHYELVQKLRLGILRIKYKKNHALNPELVKELENALLNPTVPTRLLYTLAAFEAEVLAAGHTEIIRLASLHSAYHDIAEEEVKKELTQSIVTDLFYHTPDTTTYMNGEYVKSVKIYMFCRTNRLYPCLMVMRDIHGEALRREDGQLWTHPSLASSARGLPSYTRNGNTPAGVWTIDSVMPSADQQISFGKFRRMIINFIPKSNNELLMKSLLPESSLEESWWKPTITAREAGRNLFRIHGTGKLNTDSLTPYYPFMRTSGCIAQRENTYQGVTYKDQRELLDTIMVAMDLTAKYENETKVKGILYLMEVDDEQNPVTAHDLRLWGIE